MIEVWKDIPGYEYLYQASTLGNIRSLPRNTTRGKILKPWIDRDRYPQVRLSKDGISRSFKVPVLVARAFHGTRPEKMEVRHLDGDPGNNSPGNLVYGTREENEQDKVKHGTHPQKSKTHCPQGHEYTEDNIYWAKNKRRKCKACTKKRMKDKYYGQ